LDLDSLEPDAPAGEDLLDLLPDSASQLGSVLQNVIERHVSDSVSDDTGGHGSKLFVCNGWVLGLEVVSEGLEALERSVFGSVDRPDHDSLDLNSLHLSSDLLGVEVDLVDETWELDSLILWHHPGLEADTALHKLSVSDDKQPLVGACLLPEDVSTIIDFLSQYGNQAQEGEYR